MGFNMSVDRNKVLAAVQSHWGSDFYWKQVHKDIEAKQISIKESTEKFLMHRDRVTSGDDRSIVFVPLWLDILELAVEDERERIDKFGVTYRRKDSGR